MQNELAKFGAKITEPTFGELAWDGNFESDKIQKNMLIKTYHDHRMALAFAPMSMVVSEFEIDDPMVVTKSYPGYWNDLKKAGFKVL